MSKEQFQINYNGHSVAVTPVDDNNYFVQISYKPYKINCKNVDGKTMWFDTETNKVTHLSTHLGGLIESSLAKTEV